MSAGTVMVLVAAVMRGWRLDNIRAEASGRIRQHPWIVSLILWWIWTGCSLIWSEDMAKGIEMLPGAHCYQFFAGQQAFDAMHDEDPTAFYLTDYREFYVGTV